MLWQSLNRLASHQTMIEAVSDDEAEQRVSDEEVEDVQLSFHESAKKTELDLKSVPPISL